VKRYFLVPFHSTPLLLVLTFSIGLLIALQAGLVGIPLGWVLLSWFFKYCFVLLDSLVAGEDEPPVLSIEMVNPVSEQRPWTLALLILLEGMLVAALQRHAGPATGWIAVTLLVWVLPAHVAVLGFTRNPFLAVWPPALFSLIRALGRDYIFLNAVMLVCAYIVYWMALHGVSIAPALFATQMLFLLTFALVGGAMFEHRLELGIESKTRRERLAERDAREHESERRRMLDRAYSGFRARKPLEGWKEVEMWLQLHARAKMQLVEYRAVLEATSKWDDVRVADRLANDLVAILLAKRANGEALMVVEQRLATNPRYQVLPPAQAVRIAELAAAAGKRGLQQRIASEASD
jgi:uncharacterized protein YejL (UPF0352 family)